MVSQSVTPYVMLVWGLVHLFAGQAGLLCTGTRILISRQYIYV